jgi:1,2-diacylglycerol 3-alpha-glucosyltransferase
LNFLKIAMVAACPFPAAFASSGLIREMSLALSKLGHEIHVVTYHLGRSDFVTEPLVIHRILGIPGYQKLCSGISKGKPLLDILLTLKLFQVCRHVGIDIIHAHNYEAPPAGFFSRFMLDIPVVYHAHNTMYHELPTYFANRRMKQIAEFLGGKLDRWIPKRADSVVALSDSQRDYLVNAGVPPDRLSVIPPGIFPEQFTGGDGKRIRNRLSLDKEPLVIYTGGLQPYQNCKALIPILRKIITEIADAHLLIVARSEPRYFQSQAQEAGIADRIHFLQGAGLIWERDCLAAADVAVIPRLECIGFPIKILNYLAASRPVVCFENIAGAFRSGRELIAVNSGDNDAMAGAIVRLLQDRRMSQAMAESGRQAVFERHHWDRIIPSVEAVYRQVIASRSNHSESAR